MMAMKKDTAAMNTSVHQQGFWGSTELVNNVAPSSLQVIKSDTTTFLRGTTGAVRAAVSVGASNYVSWWGKDTDTAMIAGSSCLHEPFDLKPKLPLKQSCAVSEDLYQSGQACGKCFQLNYDGSPSVHQGDQQRGTPGSVKIQIINSGAGDSKHFDCLSGVYHELTGLDTDGFPITFDEVAC
jgi:hypothetical protein